MSRTIKTPVRGRKWYQKETAFARFTTRRRFRAAEREALSTERFEDVPRPRGTQGWMSW